MEKWTAEKLENIEVSKDYVATCNGDCYELAHFEGTIGERGYAIYKILSHESHAYVMVLKSEESLLPPILLSEEETLSMLNNLEEAKKFAFNIWMNRYR